ncbi:MAG TPA: DUF3631 domain-containing protein [Stellaceae bacterium]|jgi:putative DNA primase/helicase|nr:DUF3631 domain-containing protein [Stellaceae bacterium]
MTDDTEAQGDVDAFVDTEVADDKEIQRLAELPVLDYERERVAAAKRIGCRPGVLDKLVAAERAKNAPTPETSGQGRVIELPVPELWPEPVNLAEALDDLAKTTPEYIIVSESQAIALALFAAFTHVIDAFDVSPILAVHSAEPRSGKSRLTTLMSRVSARPFAVSGISASALLRLIEMNQSVPPTLCVDEMDALMKRDPALTEALRAMINSGFDRELARHVMNVPSPDGGYEPRAFSTWCAKVFSGIGKWMPRTVWDRSINIELARKKRNEKVKRLRRRDGADLRVIYCKLARWGADNIEALRNIEPKNIPPSLNDRASDAWEPLFVIADRAGGKWPERARAAAIVLSGDGTGPADDSIGIMLLQDIQIIFDRFFKSAEPTNALSSAEIVEQLNAMAERPWVEFSRGKALSQKRLADLLGEYGISPGVVTPKEGKQFRGYQRWQLTDAWDRYIPMTPPISAIQSVNVSEIEKSKETQKLTSDSNVSGKNGADTSKNARNADGISITDILTDQIAKIPPGPERDTPRRPAKRVPAKRLPTARKPVANGNGSQPPADTDAAPDDWPRPRSSSVKSFRPPSGRDKPWKYQ